ncbi:86R [Yaba monkey tumor virus]|uniref:86R n=1 Tax=Yaba monkey tumor virus (strain VR587) TaxID=928314 RepID=Q6TUT0_YMTV5|nr:86R [Yaba monkey tumor virus]AAR07442.1 86R [Yaba monkey tumor virus]
MGVNIEMEKNNFNTSVMFETSRELVVVEKVNDVPCSKNTHVFAICITSDNKPLIAARRTSFAFQEIMMQRKNPKATLFVKKSFLKYMYSNEIKEINRRLDNGYIVSFNPLFEELILLGGKIDKYESVNDCLSREIREESDFHLSIRQFGDKLLKLTIFDKLFNKTFISYCTTCFINESLEKSLSFNIYNVEIRELKSLIDCVKNDKFNYLSFIYNTLIHSK